MADDILNSAAENKNLHANHRQRLDRKIKTGGFECLSEHEQLEYILFDVIRRGDTNALAHRILDKFGDLHGVFSASMEELMRVKGVGREVARSLSTQYDRMRIAERSLLIQPKEYKNIKDICDYVYTWLHGRLNEMLVLVSFNSVNRIIKTEIIAEGSIDQVSIYNKNIAKRALDNYAASIVIAHNHPSGIARPSKSDIITTRALISALSLLEIKFIDHIIVSDSDCYSMRKNGDI